MSALLLDVGPWSRRWEINPQAQNGIGDSMQQDEASRRGALIIRVIGRRLVFEFPTQSDIQTTP